MKEKLEKLADVASRLDLTDLEALQAAVEKTEKIYNNEPTAVNGKDRDYAYKSLERAVERLWIKYFPAEKTFKNRNEVLKYLKDLGYKISRGRLYKDCPQKGNSMMKLNPDGSVPISQVEKYIIKAELDKSVIQSPVEEFHQRKVKGEAEHKETYVEIARLKLEELKRNLIAVDEVKNLFVDRIREFRQMKLSQGRRLGPRCANKPADLIQKIIDDDNWAILEAYARENDITGAAGEDELAMPGGA